MEFTRDPWLYVRARSTEDALRFFGAPPDWPIYFDRVENKDGKYHLVWRVKSEGLDIK